jgi:two-component system OmpR family response regulator
MTPASWNRHASLTIPASPDDGLVTMDGADGAFANSIRAVSRVLVVDDEPMIVSFDSRALSAEGFQVDGAVDGSRGLEMASTGTYELVVLDLLLPSLDGVSVLQRLIEVRPSQRVLILSALTDVETKVRCLEFGASDYVSKPFSLAELIARIRARLRQPASGPEQRVLRVRGVTLDLTRRVADCGDGQVFLSEREFLLLEYLMRRDGDVCTRQRLLADVWGYSFDPGSNVVDVCVGRLRAKLGTDVIETVRSVGYRLNAS